MEFVNLGRNIKRARKNAELTQGQVCEAVGLSDNYYSAIERGIKIPKLLTLLKIAKALQVTPNDLLMDDFTGKEQILKDQFLTDSLDGLTEVEFSLIYDMVVYMAEKLKKVRAVNHKELIMYEDGYLLDITKSKR